MSSVPRSPQPVKARVRRLLVMLPWLMQRRSATVAELCERFQVSERELVADLEQVAMCGLPPFIDEVIDLYVDEGVVHVGIPRFFTAPLRLTAPEAFTLIAAARAAQALPGAEPGGPLARAVDALERALGGGPVVVDLAQPPAAAHLIAASEDGQRMWIRYWSAGRDEETERIIAPLAVFSDRGRWYVVADDERSGEERRFRVDRILEWRREGGPFARREVAVPRGDEWFDDAPDAPTVTLALAPSAHWVVERFPVREVVEPDGADGRVVARLAVASVAWLRELLLRLGTDAEVLEPAEWRGLAATAAADVLAARYAADS